MPGPAGGGGGGGGGDMEHDLLVFLPLKVCSESWGGGGGGG